MSKKTTGNVGNALHASMSRALAADAVGGMTVGRDTIDRALDIDGDWLEQRALAMGRRCVNLPTGVFTPGQRVIYGQHDWDGLLDLAVQTGRALRLCPAVAQQAGVKGETIEELRAKQQAYDAIRVTGGRIKTAGMDLRLVAGAFQHFLINQTVSYLEVRFAAADLTRAEEETLLSRFAAPLIRLEQAMQKQVQTKLLKEKVREELGERVTEAQAEAAMQEAILAVRQGLPVPRQKLFEAARRYLKQRGIDPDKLGQKEPPPITNLPVQLDPSGKPIRHIIR